MLYIIYLIGGILIGLMVATFVWVNYIHYMTFGTLLQAHDDGETYLFLDLDKPPEEIHKYKQVVLRVSPKDINTQK